MDALTKAKEWIQRTGQLRLPDGTIGLPLEMPYYPRQDVMDLVARIEELEVVRDVMKWIAEDAPLYVNGYVQNHHALDPFHDLPAFFRQISAADVYGWMERMGHVEARPKGA